MTLYLLAEALGTECVVTFFFGSCSLPLKSSNDTFFIQNEDWEKNDVVIVKSFGTKKLSFDDFLMTTLEQENENQRKKQTPLYGIAG